jgi:uncharacterized protein DUF3551
MAHSTFKRRTLGAAMRLALVCGALLTLGLLDAATPAAAQGAWCAQYSGKGGGATNCGFYTHQQCMWAVSGVGGFCSPSPYVAREEPIAPRKPRRAYR